MKSNPCTFAPLCFSIFKYKLKIENHPFFFYFRFFSFLFVTENVILKINFFEKIFIFNCPFLISLVPIESRKMKIFEPLILIQKVKFAIDSTFYLRTLNQNTKNTTVFRGVLPLALPRQCFSCSFRSIYLCFRA